MKRTITLLLLFFALLSVSAKVKITRIDPTDWYVGMKDPTLQLMVYGEGIQNPDPVSAIRESYQNGVTDEFVEPVVCDKEGSSLSSTAAS